MKKLVKALIIAVVVIFLLVAGMATAMFFYIRNNPIPSFEIGTVDLNQVRNGSYTGDFNAGVVKVVVDVDVADHKITAITIKKHDNGMGKKAETITEDIIRAQSLDVDVVSGATHSSRAILKAVEVALEKGRE